MNVSLADKYELSSGRVFMTGTQALVRLLLAQKARDEAAGLKTAGFVSGYRGSPLGSVDQELWKAQRYLDRNNITFAPGLNEDLAATAVWGTQMVALDRQATVDGVFSMWYGKGPGVDRTGDVFKHANVAGTAKLGGVLVIAGDDHTCKSSTLAHQSEHAFIAAMIPVLNPSGVREFVEFGLHGWAMSRYSGSWVGFKSISDTIETSSSFEIDPMTVDIRVPDSVPSGALSIRWPDPPLEQEARQVRQRLAAVHEYVRLNKLNRQIWESKHARLGIVSTGKSFLDALEALSMLGLDEQHAQKLGVRLLKVGVSWPLEPEGMQQFAHELDEILVVEEKRPVLEDQIKEQLYNAPSRPRVIGKRDPGGHELLPVDGELTPALIAAVFARRIAAIFGEQALPDAARLFMDDQRLALTSLDPTLPQRTPYFCSGCPHNTSTIVPEGSRATAGIGCHAMAMYMGRAELITHMGGEGAAWIGQAPFTAATHQFINLGDGTFTHSGSLAIRAAVAANVNVTYKILANDAVAMTGGQPIEGSITAIQILQRVAAEGVGHLYLVSDDPAGWKAVGGLPAGTVVSQRDNLDAVQREAREKQGVSVIVYAQTCAAEKRRRRKRAEMADPPKRVVINEEVCEGCGDCGTASNCVSIMPLETPLGRKRTIDQSSCNKDYSCVKGFCPSFVTVEGGQLRRPAKTKLPIPGRLPLPSLPALTQPYNILIAGIGGTGVVTIGALLGMAAHIEKKGVIILDMAGLAQKGGAVISHVRLAPVPEMLHSARVPAMQADLIFGADAMVSAGKDAMAASSKTRTVAVLNTDVAPTGAFVQNPDWDSRADSLLQQVGHAVSRIETVDASRIATALMGNSVATNVFMLGYVWQKGLIPLTESSLIQAIELNGASVEMNKAAFAWGRQAVLDPETARSAAGIDKRQSVIAMPQHIASLRELLTDRTTRLKSYQSASYARRYADYVNEIAVAEMKAVGTDALARTVAVSLYKTMAYKDEYEVARLYTESGFFEKVALQFEGSYRLRFHLAPPLLARKDFDGRLRKRQYGPWVATVFKVLAKARRVRGSVLDPFGYTEERRCEREQIGKYMSLMRDVVRQLSEDNKTAALELARLPQTVRGYGHVKKKALAAANIRQEKLLEELAVPAKTPAEAQYS